MSNLIAERSAKVVQGDTYAPGRFIPDRTITPELQHRIDEIAVAYAQGEYADIDDYTVNIGRHARDLGMPWGQLKDELGNALRGAERIMKFDKTPVIRLLMSNPPE